MDWGRCCPAPRGALDEKNEILPQAGGLQQTSPRCGRGLEGRFRSPAYRIGVDGG